MYWFISRFPELDHLEPAQREQVLRQVPWWTYPLIIARAVIPSLLLGLTAGTWLASVSGSDSAALVGIPLAVLITTGLYGYQLTRVRGVMRGAINEGYRGERMPFCFECGYDLRDQAAPRCPECGSPVGGGTAT